MLVILLLLPTLSLANNDVDLFGVFKPVHNENVLEVQARMDGCHVLDLDYEWHMGADAHGNNPVSKKRSAVESQIRKRFVVSQYTSPTNAASCQKLSPPAKVCNSISATAAELGWVSSGLKDPSLVIRADQNTAGACEVGAYLDVKGRAVKVSALQVLADNVVIKQFLGLFTGATFRVKSVDINPFGQKISFPCLLDCDKSEP